MSVRDTSRKRALFLCPSPFEIGTYFRAQAFARQLVRDGGFEVDLICTSIDGTSSEAMIEGVHVVQTAKIGPSLLPMRGWNPGEIFRRFASVLRAPGKYDLIYSFEYQPSVAGIAFPLSLFSHAVHFNDWCDWYAGRHHKMKGIRFLQKIDAWMEEFPRRRVDCVTTINTALYERSLASGVAQEKLMLVREGAEDACITVSRSEARARLGLSKWGISDDAFLVVAMLDQETEIHERAIVELNRVRAGSRLVLLGNWKPERAVPEEMITPGRVSDEELDLWLQAVDCAWLPLADTLLNRGRLPHKIGHFRMYGLPLITTPVGDIPALGDDGIILVGNQSSEFASATAALSPLSEKARLDSQSIAKQIYGWKRILAPLIDRITRACF